jgi:hypothetical protein
MRLRRAVGGTNYQRTIARRRGSGKRSGRSSTTAPRIALYFVHYRFARVHQTFRVTPAMEAAMADDVSSVGEIVILLM